MRVALLLALLLLGGCERYRVVYDSPLRDAEVIRENNILAARIRRAQLIAEIARINHVLRFTRTAENRIVLEQALNDRTVELERLNVIVFAP
jgi:uncharacterized lipoprotein YajG